MFVLKYILTFYGKTTQVKTSLLQENIFKLLITVLRLTFHCCNFLKCLNTCQSTSVETYLDLWLCGEMQVVTISLITARFWDKVCNLNATDSKLDVYLSPPIQSIYLHLLIAAEQPQEKQHNERKGGRVEHGR